MALLRDYAVTFAVTYAAVWAIAAVIFVIGRLVTGEWPKC